MHVNSGWSGGNFESGYCGRHGSPDTDFFRIVEVDDGRPDDVIQSLRVICAPHFTESGIRLLIGLGPPMRLMGSAPPSSSTIAELACGNEIARQHRVASPLTREVSDNHRGKNCDVSEGPPIDPTNRWLFSYRVHGYTHGDSLIGDFVDIGFLDTSH